MLKNAIAVAGLSMLLCLAGCGSKKPKGQLGQEFDRARHEMITGQFGVAFEALSEFSQEHSNHALAPRATFLAAKCQMGRDDLAGAKLWFNKTIEQYPESEEAHKSRFKLAMIDLLQGETLQARSKLQLLLAAADGPYTPEAAAWIQHLNEAELADVAER